MSSFDSSDINKKIFFNFFLLSLFTLGVKYVHIGKINHIGYNFTQKQKKRKMFLSQTMQFTFDMTDHLQDESDLVFV